MSPCLCLLADWQADRNGCSCSRVFSFGQGALWCGFNPKLSCPRTRCHIWWCSVCFSLLEAWQLCAGKWFNFFKAWFKSQLAWIKYVLKKLTSVLSISLFLRLNLPYLMAVLVQLQLHSSACAHTVCRVHVASGGRPQAPGLPYLLVTVRMCTVKTHVLLADCLLPSRMEYWEEARWSWVLIFLFQALKSRIIEK